MNLNIKTTENTDEIAFFIASSILRHLGLGKRVFFFVTGGSSIPVCVKISEIIRSHPHSNLAVTLTDERYGPVGHAYSNWSKLIAQGFSLPEAKLIPVLTGADHLATTINYTKSVDQEFKNTDYKIGIFGVGIDGHTAGILPGSVAVNSKDLICGYETPEFSRITITPFAIIKLDEAIICTKGEEKWKVIKQLDEEEIDINVQPAQILKKVPLLTIFTDYKSN